MIYKRNNGWVDKYHLCTNQQSAIDFALNEQKENCYHLNCYHLNKHSYNCKI